MIYEFVCAGDPAQGVQCSLIQVRAPISEGPQVPHCAHGPMRRLYGVQQAPAIIQWDSMTYVERAIDGKEKVPGLSKYRIRGILETSKPNTGRRNNRDYGSSRQRSR